MTKQQIELNELLQQIERYFDCSLSDEEEQLLRSAIAETTLDHPSIDEVRALMGFRRPSLTINQTTPKSMESRRRLLITATGIAASIALIVVAAFGISSLGSASKLEPTCIAYIHGETVTDEEAVIRQLTADMKDFGISADEIDNSFQEELDEVSEIINKNESADITPFD